MPEDGSPAGQLVQFLRELYDARGTFLFSADNEAEAERMLEE